MKRGGFGAATALWCVLTASVAHAQIVGANLNTPESLASSVVGASTQGIMHPGTSAAFGAGLLNGFDENGNYKAGLGIEGSPALLLQDWLAPGAWITPDEYHSNVAKRILARTAISAATAKGATSDDKSAQVGFGIQTALMDWSDPALDQTIVKCIQDGDAAASREQTAPGTIVVPNQDFPGKEKYQAALAKVATDCLKVGSPRLWNRSSWTIGFGDALASQSGAFSDLKQQTWQFNTTLAWGFDNFSSVDPDRWAEDSTWGMLRRKAQLLLGAQYINGQLQPNPSQKGSLFSQNVAQVGVAVRYRWFDPKTPVDPQVGDIDFSFRNTILSFQAVYLSKSPDSMPHSNDQTFTVAAEFKLADGTYLDVGIGADRKESNGSSSGFALTQLKYAVSNLPFLLGR